MRPVVAPGGLLAVLCLVLAAELMTPDRVASEPDAGARPLDAAAPAVQARGAQPPAPAFDPGALASVAATIIARPLFNPDRRPAANPADPAAARAEVAEDGLPRLTGVIVGPSGARAIFAGANGKSRAAAEGDTVGAFKVRTIGPGLVTVSGSEGDRVLRPTYVTATTTTTTTTTTAGPPPGALLAVRPGERAR